MNKKGFTLVELIATIVVLGIIVGITMYTINGGFGRAKEKTEDIFVETLEDALKMYLDSDARKLSFSSSSVCELSKTHGVVKVYKSTDNITFNDVINSEYVPLIKEELHNPANKNADNYECSSDGVLSIYRDDDYVYYYKIDKADFECLNNSGYITNLPDGCD